LSFITFGIVPLIVYVLVEFLHIAHLTHMMTFYISVAASGLTLIVMGVIKGKLTGSNSFVSSFLTLILGGIAAGVGYGIGFGLDYYFPHVNIHF
jgi:VIT1/CCC1 family predicted Fe2+/Mn2+ transporter